MLKSNNPIKSRSKYSYRNCGGTYPNQRGSEKCPAFGKTCRSYAKFNHFAKYCCSSDKSKTDKDRKKLFRRRSGRRSVNEVQKAESDNNGDSNDQTYSHCL